MIWLMDILKIYGYFKRTALDKILRDKVFNIARNVEYDGYQRGLASMFINFLIKNLLCLQINLFLVVVLLCYKMSNSLKNYTNQSLTTLKKEQFILHLKTIFGVLI